MKVGRNGRLGCGNLRFYFCCLIALEKLKLEQTNIEIISFNGMMVLSHSMYANVMC